MSCIYLYMYILYACICVMYKYVCIACFIYCTDTCVIQMYLYMHGDIDALRTYICVCTYM